MNKLQITPKKKKRLSKRKKVMFKRMYKGQRSKRRKRNFIKKTLVFSIIAVIVFSLVGFFTYKSFYNHYEEIVRNRIQAGFWQSRAGIYAAPKEFRVGQRINQAELISNLRKAGYVKGEKDSFWNGTFITDKTGLKIKNNKLYDEDEEIIKVLFDNEKISKITKEDQVISKFTIKPELLTGRSEAKRTGIKALRYDQIPADLRNAIIVTEDRRFFEHSGVDPKGIMRAFWANLNERRVIQGGSTITQQLVKNTFLTNERTYQRKFSEAFLALALENLMSKEDIFTLYCNEIYLGQYGITGVHGFGMASRAYFEKDISDITLAEAVSLASMIRRPNYFTLGKHSDELKSRRELILSLMQKYNFISPEQTEIAKNEQVVFSKPKAELDAIAPYFVDQVTKEVPTKVFIDETDDNLRVYTTIDTQVQELAENAVRNHLAKLEKTLKNKDLKPQATLIAMNPHNGEVLAIVGGSDYAETQYNRATQAQRQPGSVFKPFIYATALERGLLPSSVFADKATEFTYDRNKKYKPANYGDYYQNKKITLKTALAKSSNVVAVQTALRAGLHKISEKSEEFGFKGVKPYPSVALGTIEVTPVELAAAYSSFANSGRKVVPTYINHIRAGDGSIIYQSKLSEKKVISDETAYMLTDMMKAVVKRGTASSFKNSLSEDVVFAGKTGSSKDAWFVGYTPNLVTVAWVGFDENEDIGLTGGEAALPLWSTFMKDLLSKRPEFGGSKFDRPVGLTEVTIDPETGMLADPNCPRREKVIVPQRATSNVYCFRHKVYPETQIATNTYDIKESDFENSFDDEIAREIDVDKKEKSIKRKVIDLENETELNKIEISSAKENLQNTGPARVNKEQKNTKSKSNSNGANKSVPKNPITKSKKVARTKLPVKRNKIQKRIEKMPKATISGRRNSATQ